MKKCLALALALVVVGPSIVEAGCHHRKCGLHPVRKVLRLVTHPFRCHGC